MGKHPLAIHRVFLAERRNIRIRQRRRGKSEFEIAAARSHIPDTIFPAFQLFFPHGLFQISIRLPRKKRRRIKFALHPSAFVLAEPIDFSSECESHVFLRNAFVNAPEIIVFVNGQAVRFFSAFQAKRHSAVLIRRASPKGVRKKIFGEFFFSAFVFEILRE